MAYRLQDPDSANRHAIDWSDFLETFGSPSDTIVTSTWSVKPSHSDQSPDTDVEPLITDTSVVDGNLTVCKLSKCRDGQIYRLTNRIVTANAETDERSIILRCAQR